MNFTQLTLSLLTSIGLVLLSSTTVFADDQIVEIRGNATLKRAGKAETIAREGQRLFFGDRLTPADGSVVRVQCQNRKIPQVRLPSGLGNICPDSVAQRFSTRGRGEEEFLAFVNQRFNFASQFLDASPQFRWNPDPDIKQYRIKISPAPGNQAPIWQIVTKEPQVVYDGPPLEPGQHYRLVVSSQGSYQEKILSQFSFRVVEPESARQLKEQVSELNEADLGTVGLSLSTVNLYQAVAQPNTTPPEGVGLVMESLPVLEVLTTQEPGNPYFQRLKGDLSLQVGLIEQAATAYDQALKLSRNELDLIEEAEASIGLAKLAAVKGDRTSAQNYLNQAKLIYASLNDTEMVSLLNQWLEKLY